MKKRGRTPTVDKWLEDDNLLLLESLARDGYTLRDIARRVGVDYVTICKWRDKYQPIGQALSVGKEITDYKVENALLKAALGYRTKETKITTTMRYGKVVETITETTEREQAPNIAACQTWLYNRSNGKWRNMNSKNNIFDDMEEDTSIEITVTRANKNESGSGSEDDRNIEVRKRTKSEQQQYEEELERKKQQDIEEEKKTTEVINEDEFDGYDENLDEWPEDWEDDE